jgi:hypothetical protein
MHHVQAEALYKLGTQIDAKNTNFQIQCYVNLLFAICYMLYAICITADTALGCLSKNQRMNNERRHRREERTASTPIFPPHISTNMGNDG